MGFFRVLWNFRSTLLLVLTPLVLLPLPLVLRSSEAACGYCIIVMATYWIAEVLPLAVTAFLPLVLFPLMGIMKASDVSVQYTKDTTWLFVGGLMIAVAVEYTNLHRRIALSVLLLVGSKPHSIMLGFMLPTYFLSMWISNSATTAMMIPIVNAVLQELRSERKRKKIEYDDITSLDSNIEEKGTEFFTNPAAVDVEVKTDEKTYQGTSLNEVYQLEQGSDSEIAEEKKSTTEGNNENSQEKDEDIEISKMDKGLTICVPYAASIGGISTITGTGPNLVLAGQYEILYPYAEPKITFSNWIAYHLPLSLTLLFFGYIWLMWLYLGLGPKTVSAWCRRGHQTDMDKKVHQVLTTEYKKLGEIRWAEVTVVIVLTTTVLLWFFREPGFMPGWGELFKDGFVSDGTVAMTMAVSLFMLPSKRPTFLVKRPEDPKDNKPVPAILNWSVVHRMMPWNVVFLIGGGFALAEGATQSGFSTWLGNQLAALGDVPDWAVCLIVTIITCLFTECTSNVATASLFIPIISQLAQATEIHPLYLLLPAVVATSLAFMLPVATPPNAIAFSYGYLKVIDLVKAGWFLNILGIAILMLFINTYAVTLFGVDEFPDWAAANYTPPTTLPNIVL